MYDIIVIYMTKLVRKSVRYKCDCDECNESFSWRSTLSEHIKFVHQNVQYNCETCNKSFSQKGTLKTHIKTVHENVRYNSDKYLKNFTKIHLNESTVESTNDKSEELEKSTTVALCGTSDHSSDINCFEQENVAIMQMIPCHSYPSSDHDYVEKKSTIFTAKYKCDKCERSFDKKTNFYIHMQSEHGSFYCEKCDKSFSQKGTLKTHIQSVHENVRYNCDKCDKSFSQKGNLNVHVRSVHKKVRYDCDKCEKSFWWKGELKEHTYIHTKKVELIVPTPKQNDFLRPIMKARNDNSVSHHKVVHVNQPKQFGNYFKHKEVYQYYDKKK